MSEAEQSRYEDLKRLLSYQQNDLDRLSAKMTNLDDEIDNLEIRVAHNTNVLSAARGLVGMRRGNQPAVNDKQFSSRCRPKQRFWSNADGSLSHSGRESTVEPTSYVKPAGTIYTEFQKRFEAPRQSFTGTTGNATILLSSHACDENGMILANLRNLHVGARVWLVYWFDRNSGLWRNFVRPPRAKGGWRIGVFATRSPNRPSPIGLSLAKVEHVDIDSRKLVVSGIDVLDETPLLGLKPYDAENEVHPHARSGWLDDTEGLQPLYYDPMVGRGNIPDVVLSDSASAKLEFIDERSAVNIRSMVEQSLKRRVFVSPMTCNGKPSEDRAVLAVGSFRVTYQNDDRGQVLVTDVISGMRQEVCEAEADSDPEVRIHLDFQKAFANVIYAGT